MDMDNPNPDPEDFAFAIPIVDTTGVCSVMLNVPLDVAKAIVLATAIMKRIGPYNPQVLQCIVGDDPDGSEDIAEGADIAIRMLENLDVYAGSILQAMLVESKAPESHMGENHREEVEGMMVLGMQEGWVQVAVHAESGMSGQHVPYGIEQIAALMFDPKIEIGTWDPANPEGDVLPPTES